MYAFALELFLLSTKPSDRYITVSLCSLHVQTEEADEKASLYMSASGLRKPSKCNQIPTYNAHSHTNQGYRNATVCPCCRKVMCCRSKPDQGCYRAKPEKPWCRCRKNGPCVSVSVYSKTKLTTC